MNPTLADMMKAIDDLEHVYQDVFESYAPLYTDQPQRMRRALAVLHAWVKQAQQNRK